MVFNGMLDFIGWVFVVLKTVMLSMILGTTGRAVILCHGRFGRVSGQMVGTAIRSGWCGCVTVGWSVGWVVSGLWVVDWGGGSVAPRVVLGRICGRWADRQDYRDGKSKDLEEI